VGGAGRAEKKGRRMRSGSDDGGWDEAEDEDLTEEDRGVAAGA
jgi:hypothetical protein